MKIYSTVTVRDQDKPEPYKKGYVEFYKLKFFINQDVLIPRPETELLVDEVLNSIKYYVSSIKGEEILVLDIGTGSGSIAVSIAKNAPDVQIIATDISNYALKIAKKNSKFHGVEKRIKFVQSNLLENPIILNTKYKILIIVTNLPYIPSGRIPYLDSSVKDFEPHIALDGGDDGFELYRKLFQQIISLPEAHRPKMIVGEIDYTHGELAVSETLNYFPQAQVEVKNDLAHKQRILIIQNSISPLA